MERHLAEMTLKHLGKDGQEARVVAPAGTGGNGGWWHGRGSRVPLTFIAGGFRPIAPDFTSPFFLNRSSLRACSLLDPGLGSAV